MEELLSTLVLHSFRFFAALVFLPWEGILSGAALRVALSILFACLTLPASPTQLELAGPHIFAELMLGFLLGLPLALVVSLAHSAGDIFDSARGLNISDMYDPLHGLNSSYSATMRPRGVALERPDALGRGLVQDAGRPPSLQVFLGRCHAATIGEPHSPYNPGNPGGD